VGVVPPEAGVGDASARSGGVTHVLLEIPVGLLALLMIVASVGATLIAARLLPAPKTDDSPALTALHATVSTIYTVLVAFVVVIVWQQFSDAGSRVETEATRLSNILRDAVPFQSQDGGAIRTAVREYIELTSTREWDAMAEGKAPDAQSNAAYERIWDAVYHLRPSGPTEEAFYSELAGRMNELGAARRSRLLSARGSVPWILWLLLVGGGAMIGYLSILLPSPDGHGRTVALAATGSVIALTLFVILVFDHPYSGSIHVDPGPLRDLLSR
jgi:hypothetical protein